ncbi:MAG: PP2C family protein-serine/threonine phosphatase [Desulfuromonadaceae bacterium]
MPDKILIASAEPSVQLLSGVLRDVGHQVTQVAEPEPFRRQLRDMPDALLLDAGLLDRFPRKDWQGIDSDLKTIGIPCLRFSPQGMEPERMRAITPWAVSTLVDLSNREHVLEQVELLLSMNRLLLERTLAEERLLAHRIEIEQGLSSASHIQHSLLPNARPQTEEFSFAWQFLPCQTVGGDLFNLAALSEDLLMVYLIDVSGHGVSSAMVTVSVYQSLAVHTGQLVKRLLDRPPYYQILGPAEVLSGLDREYPYERFEKFFTIVYLLLEPATGRIRYCNGGHPFPVIVRADGRRELLREGGTLIGLGGVLPYADAEVQLFPGDRLYLYSDGVTEYFSATGELFGEQRLFDFLSQNHACSLDRTLQRLMDWLQDFGAGETPGDDVSIFGIQYNGAPADSSCGQNKKRR